MVVLGFLQLYLDRLLSFVVRNPTVSTPANGSLRVRCLVY